MDHNISVHRFDDNYSNEDLINSVQHSEIMTVDPALLKELRMVQKVSFKGVFPIAEEQISYQCLEIKHDRNRNLILIRYRISFQDNIDWNKAKINFERFLARHTHTAHANVNLIYIVWNAFDCWYIMTGNQMLRQALIRMVSKPTVLETLPDEILLEICLYLLNVDILSSFFNLNSRMRRMISQYYRDVSLHKASITQSSFLCQNVLPQIGSRIQSLVLDRCYSVMQHELFMKHFSNNMSIIFPCLKKISLVGFQYSHIMSFLEKLQDLESLNEIQLHDLFGINEEYQANVIRTLLQANNHRLTSVFINNGSSFLKFYETDCYMNILQLRITLREIKDLSSLFTVVPNVRYLDVTLVEEDMENLSRDQMKISSLEYLLNFQLRSTKRWWNTEELSTILDQLPYAKTIALFLCVLDAYLVYGNTILSLLPSTIQQFHYAAFYSPTMIYDQDNNILTSWSESHPITCYRSDDFGFIHTLPWYFKNISFPTSIGKLMSKPTKCKTGYDERVKKIEIIIDKNLTLAKSLAVIAQCRRLRHLVISINSEEETIKEESNQLSSLPILPELTQIFIYASKTIDFDQLSMIFFAAPNLFRLDLPCDFLLHLLENQQIRDTLGRSVKSLVILDATKTSSIKLNEEHVRFIASTFTNLSDIYVDVTHLTSNAVTDSNEIMPGSMESMIVCLLSKFISQKLISLVVDIQPSEEMKTNSKEWLYKHTILHQQLFDADYNTELNRLIIWM
ncbi:hypothetical protein I4U23_019869 [Adineta vaga]|nr:hypothetical protein I4U23_019869 [Adineta vaga]